MKKNNIDAYKNIANNHEKGKFAEDIAVNHLKEQGYTILKKNYRNSFGEIDIIAQCNKKIIFVEVKSTNSKQYSPLDKITKQKRKKIYDVARLFLYHERKLNISTAFEVVTIDIKTQQIQHFKEEFFNF